MIVLELNGITKSFTDKKKLIEFIKESKSIDSIKVTEHKKDVVISYSTIHSIYFLIK